MKKIFLFLALLCPLIGWSQLTLTQENLQQIRQKATSQERSWHMFQSVIDSLHAGSGSGFLRQGANTLTQNLAFDGAFNVRFGFSTPITTFSVTNSVGSSFQVVGGDIVGNTPNSSFDFGSALINFIGPNSGSSVNQFKLGTIATGPTVWGAKLVVGGVDRFSITEAGVFKFLPAVAPVVGQVITATNTDGTWTWQTPASGISGLTTNRIPYAASSTTLADNANFTIDNGTGVVTFGQPPIVPAPVSGTDATNKTYVDGLTLPIPLTPDNGGTGVVNNVASTLTISGNFASTFTVTGTTGVIFPTSGTLISTAPGTSGNVLTSNGSAWLSSAPASAGWPLTGTGTFTGAVVIDETTTGANTLKFKANSLGVSPVDGKGLWMYNDAVASLGNQQISPSLVLDGQGWATGVNTSQSVKFRADVLPVQAATNPTGYFRIAASINGAAYANDGLRINSDAGTNRISIFSSTGLITGGLGVNVTPVANQLIYSSAGLTISGAAAQAFLVFTQTASTKTSGSYAAYNFLADVSPTSGTAAFWQIYTNPTINQTGGANGQVIIFNAVPTITAAVNVTGYDWNPTTPANISGLSYGFWSRPTAALNGFGVTPTALVTVGAGTTTVAPFKLTSGTNMTTAVAGVMEYDGTTLFFTRTGTTRESIVTDVMTQTLSGKTLTAPKFVSGGFIADANGNEELIFTTTASAVNEITVTNAIAGAGPSLKATGADTDIPFGIVTKGSGNFNVLSATAGSFINTLFQNVGTFNINRASTDVTGSEIIFQKIRGTQSSPTTIANGDNIGLLTFNAYEGTGYNTAQIKAIINGTVSAGVAPTDLVFYTTATNSLSEKLRITSTGIGNNSGGFKHARVTTGSVGAGSTALVTITWGTAFADANYTVQASVLEATTSSLSISVVHVESITASAVTVRVINNAVGSLTGTVHVIACHD